MANHKSAAKRARQSVVKAANNTKTRSSIRTFERKLEKVIGEKNKDEALKVLIAVTSRLDKAAQKGVIHAKTAARKISRLSKRVQTLAK